MARMTLSDMLRALRAETGRSVSVSHGVAERENLVHLLQRVQETLWREHDWPFLMVDRDVSLAAGQRRYNYPADMSFDFVNAAWTQVGGVWTPVCYGITPDDFSVHDSDAGALAWPVQKWQHDADNDQIEVWPVPDQAGVLRLRGRKTCAALVDDSDMSTLDGHLIVLFAAAEVLARGKQEDAQLKLAQAQTLLRRILARQSSNKRGPWLVGGRSNARLRPRPGIDYIPMGYSGA